MSDRRERGVSEKMNARLVVLLTVFSLQASATEAISCVTCDADCSFNFFFSSCHCDPGCEEYGDCCETRPPECAAPNPPSGRQYECVEASLFGNGMHAWMVVGCPGEWDASTLDGRFVLDNCLNDSQFASIPVTDAETEIVYKNRLCAMCHGVPTENMLKWIASYECDLYLEILIENNMVEPTLEAYQEAIDLYCTVALARQTVGNRTVPRRCYGRYSPTPPCLPGFDSMLDDCLNGFDNLVEESNAPTTQIPRRIYKNEFCARCIGISDSFIQCAREPNFGNTISFTLVLDINQDGLLIASSTFTSNELDVSCGAEEVFDPVVMQCRQTIESILEGLRVAQTNFNCTDTLIALGQNYTFEMIDSSTVLYNGEQHQIAFFNTNQEPVICVNFTQNATQITTISCATNEVFDPVVMACRTIQQMPIVNTTNCTAELIALGQNDTFQIVDANTVLYNDEQHQIVFNNSNQEPVICVNFTQNATEVTTISCETNQVFDPVAMTCRGRQEVPDCSGELIALGLNDTFQVLDATTILYNDQRYQIELVTRDQELVICVDFTQNGTQIVNTTVIVFKYPLGFVLITYVGCSLSVVGCLLLLLTYCCFRELLTLPSKILMNLAIAIMVADLLLIVGVPIVEILVITELCTAIAVCLHFFFLALFSWMTILCFEMMRTFYNAHRMKPVQPSTTLFVIYVLLGWGVPFLIVGAAVVANYLTAAFSTLDNLILYGVLDNGMVGSCWINHFESAIVAFIAPVALSLLLNLIFFTVIVVLLCLAVRSQTRLDKDNKNTPYIRVVIAIFLVSGLTWGFGFLAILIGTAWSWYPYILLNSTQGLVIFLAFLCTKKVGGLYLSICRKGGKKPATKTTKLSKKSGDLSSSKA